MWRSSIKGTLTASLRSLAHGVPLAERLRIARRDVGILRVAADAARDLPRAAALAALGEIDHDRDAGNVGQPERIGRAFVIIWPPSHMGWLRGS